MTDFERVSDEVSGENNYETTSECMIAWVRGDKVATVQFTNASRYNTRVRKLAEEYPDDVKIRHENTDGSIVATLPLKFVKISAPRRISDEQKEAAAERLKKAREGRNNSLPSECNVELGLSE